MFLANFCIKILAKLVNCTENFYNFIVGNHCLCSCMYLIFSYKDAECLQDYQFFRPLSYPELAYSLKTPDTPHLSCLPRAYPAYKHYQSPTLQCR